MTLSSECSTRIVRLQQFLAAAELDGALFIYPIDVYYFSGTRQTASLWVPVSGEATLLVRKSLERAKQEAVIADIRPFPRSKEFAPLFSGCAKVGMTFDVVPVQQLNYYSKLLPDLKFVDISAGYRSLRSEKSVWELERMRHAGKQLSAVFAAVPEFFRPGMCEVELAAEFERRLRLAGGEGYVRMRAFNQELFHGLAVAGASAATGGFFDGAVTGQGMSAAAAHGSSTAKIEANQPILLDYTGVFEGYIVDMTRMFVCGDLDPQLLHAFAVARDIQAAVVAALRPGAICSELFQLSKKMADDAGLGNFYMGTPGENARFVGHGVGLELDEVPVLAQGFDEPLVAGQTIAVEPKFVFPGMGPIGIENTYAVTSAGGEKLTPLEDNLVNL